MRLSGEGKLLRIFLGDSDKLNNKPLYEQIVFKAKELGLAGVTVLHGVMGFGAGSRIHTAKVIRLSEDLPVIVEIVDNDDNINKLIPYLNEVVREGMVTIEKVEILKYRSKMQS